LSSIQYLYKIYPKAVLLEETSYSVFAPTTISNSDIYLTFFSFSTSKQNRDIIIVERFVCKFSQ